VPTAVCRREGARHDDREMTTGRPGELDNSLDIVYHSRGSSSM